MKPIYQIAQLVGDLNTAGKPYFVVETYMTKDGPRTRICNGRWATYAQAEFHIRNEGDNDGH